MPPKAKKQEDAKSAVASDAAAVKEEKTKQESVNPAVASDAAAEEKNTKQESVNPAVAPDAAAEQKAEAHTPHAKKPVPRPVPSPITPKTTSSPLHPLESQTPSSNLPSKPAPLSKTVATASESEQEARELMPPPGVPPPSVQGDQQAHAAEADKQPPFTPTTNRLSELQLDKRQSQPPVTPSSVFRSAHAVPPLLSLTDSDLQDPFARWGIGVAPPGFLQYRDPRKGTDPLYNGTIVEELPTSHTERHGEISQIASQQTPSRSSKHPDSAKSTVEKAEPAQHDTDSDMQDVTTTQPMMRASRRRVRDESLEPTNIAGQASEEVQSSDRMDTVVEASEEAQSSEPMDITGNEDDDEDDDEAAGSTTAANVGSVKSPRKLRSHVQSQK